MKKNERDILVEILILIQHMEYAQGQEVIQWNRQRVMDLLKELLQAGPR